MPNRRHQKPPSVKVSPGTPKAASSPRITQKAAWPTANLPGPTQPRDRSMGVRKVKVSMKAEGI